MNHDKRGLRLLSCLVGHFGGVQVFEILVALIQLLQILYVQRQLGLFLVDALGVPLRVVEQIVGTIGLRFRVFAKRNQKVIVAALRWSLPIVYGRQTAFH